MFHRTKNVACLGAVIFAGALAWNAAPAGALQNLREEKSPWIVEKIPGNPVGYCHMKFPAIDEKTLGTDDPRLQPPDAGSIIDFYGPCDHDPLGAEEVQKQIQEQQLERSRPGGED
jgi:hypothetical protein